MKDGEKSIWNYKNYNLLLHILFILFNIFIIYIYICKSSINNLIYIIIFIKIIKEN